MHGILAGVGLPTPDGHIDIMRVQIHAIGNAPRLFRGHDGGPAAHKRVEDDIIAVRAVAQDVGNHDNGLAGGVHRQLLITMATEGVHASVIPDIGTVAALFAEAKVVDVGRRPILEDQHQLVLITIKCAHTTIILGPNRQLLDGAVNRLASG